jgi:spore coat protein CotH
VPQNRANLSTGALFRAFAMFVAFVFVGQILGTDAATAATPTKPAAVVNTGQYREGDDPAAPLFDPLVVHRIDMTVPQASIDYMNQHSSGAAPGSHGDYQPATMTFTNKLNNQTTPVMDVGIRLKGGWGSARNMDQKPAFKVKMNYSVKGQTLYGLKKLTLNNMVQDNSMLHEVVGYRLFRAVGVPSSRAGYVRIYINGQDYGLHLNVETYDMVSLARHFATTTHLYEGAYWQDLVNSQYDAMQVDEGDSAVKTDLQNLAAANTIDPYNPSQVSTWFTEVQKYADLNEMITEWATERYIADWDGYSWQIKNNYYAHFDAQGIASILVSGIDQTSTGGLGIFDANSASQMFQNCMASAPCTALYVGALNKVRATAISLDLDKMIQDVQSAITTDVASDPRKAQSFNDFNWAVQDSRNFHANQPASVANQTNFNKSSNVSLSYTYEWWVNGAKFTPTTAHGGTAAAVFSVVNGADRCSINSSTGVVTVIKLGWCRVSVSVPASTGWGASLNYFTFLPGTVVGSVTIAPVASLAYDSTTTLDVTADSIATPALTVEGPCLIVGQTLTATAGSGTCVVGVSVPSDGTYTSASATISVKLVRAQALPYEISNTKGFTTQALPKGGVIALVRNATKMTGPCKLTGKVLKANADRGVCQVSFAKWNDALFNHAAQVTKIKLVSATQVFAKDLTPTGTFSYRDGLQLSIKSPVLTNWLQEGEFSTNGNCETSVDMGGSTWAFDTSGLPCKVTISVGKLFGLKGLTRTWILKP